VALEDCELLAQREVFEDERLMASGEEPKQSKQTR
jgi:hypothetical protein